MDYTIPKPRAQKNIRQLSGCSLTLCAQEVRLCLYTYFYHGIPQGSPRLELMTRVQAGLWELRHVARPEI